jgi:hypothetical protein
LNTFTASLRFDEGKKAIIFLLKDFLYQGEVSCPPEEYHALNQGCRSGSGSVSGSGLDPDSIESVDPDPDSESGYRRAKITHKSRKKFKKFMF